MDESSLAFDLTQLVSSPTRVTQSSSTIIDHIYTSNPENIIETFVPTYALSDHFLVSLSRKVNAKISKNSHTTTSYRCFKKFDETMFLSDLSSCLTNFKSDRITIDHDFAEFYCIILQCLDKHALVKLKRVICLANTSSTEPDLTKLTDFVNNKVPNATFF